MRMTTWLITGCSAGLGRSLAQAVLKAGFNVVVTARNPDSVADIVSAYPKTAVAAALDVTDRQAIDRVVALAGERFGGIDVLVNNAGYGYRAAVEEGDEEEVAALFATNVFGPVSVIKAVLPGMRERKTGTIVNISSIAAQRSSPGSGFYSATKRALEGLSDALRKEVAPLGIKVLIVEPGAFRTEFAGRSLRGSDKGLDAYATTAGPRRKGTDKTHGTQPGDPDLAAQVMMDTIMGGDLPVRLLLGRDAIAVVGEEIEAQRAEIKAWSDVSVKTDFTNR
ncbi:SDR family NAD(P)-dependent oxidoreductase [Acidisoma cellulosilytica]|uniref:SDR family NAD(P)-dependent oxidoreductase n=2 Tax=Acidisoma cellulosilyticum TaxID=2802395 RepID=A0A963YYR9_9PROT|nr:SDR family NAD(P)-dependent oxidoreductase [Acidisoma cellulosilyticum]